MPITKDELLKDLNYILADLTDIQDCINKYGKGASPVRSIIKVKELISELKQEI